MKFNLYAGLIDVPESACDRLLGMAIVRVKRQVSTGVRILKEGSVLFWVAKDRKYRVYQNVVQALRACEHMGSQYGWSAEVAPAPGEIQAMGDFIVEHLDMCLQLLNWSGMTAKQRAQHAETCRYIVAELKGVRDENKIKLAGWTNMATDIRDSLGRQNPSRTMTLHTAARFSAMSRQEQILAIAQRIDYRKAALLREVVRNTELRREVRLQIGYMLERYDFGDRSTSYYLSIIGTIVGVTQYVHDRPWRHVFDHTREDLRTGIQAAIQDNWQELRRRIHIAHTALRLYDHYDALSRAQTRLARARRLRGEWRRRALISIEPQLLALANAARDENKDRVKPIALMQRFHTYVYNAREALRREDATAAAGFLREAEMIF